jgi:uracil-DNA glycosylase family protein
MRVVRIAPAFTSWQRAARRLLADQVAPEEVRWIELAPTLVDLADSTADDEASSPRVTVPRRFVELARAAAAHPDPDRWAALYRVLWRLVTEQRDLLAHRTDPDVGRLEQLATEARSRPAATAGGTAAPVSSARSFVPPDADLPALRRAAAHCTGCDLYKRASQTVFGEGPAEARMMLVGEQPGDQEDRQGRPFVGPAGEVLDHALAEVGLDRRQLYVTNAVKHFKWIARGKRRLHEKPSLADMEACRPWLEAELALVKPTVLVCLGATAAQTLFGPTFRVLKERGRPLSSRWAPHVVVTIHPSAVLRAPDPDAQEATYRTLVADLKLAAELLASARR